MCTFVRVYVCTFVRLYVCSCVRLYVCTCGVVWCGCVCVRACVRACVCACAQERSQDIFQIGGGGRKCFRVKLYNFSVHLLFYRINGLNSHILIILISRIICEVCEPKKYS